MRHEIWQCLAKDLHFHGQLRRWCMDINHMLFIPVPINIAITSTGLVPNSANWFIIAAYSLPTFWGRIYSFMFTLSDWLDCSKCVCQVKGECNVWDLALLSLQLDATCQRMIFQSASDVSSWFSNTHVRQLLSIIWGSCKVLVQSLLCNRIAGFFTQVTQTRMRWELDFHCLTVFCFLLHWKLIGCTRKDFGVQDECFGR